MNPTASQAYLALDIVSHVPPSPEHAELHRRASGTLQAALVFPEWTGKTAKCSEYGKPPVTDDPEAQVAVKKVNLLMERLASVNDASPLHETLRDIRQIVQG